MGLSLDVKYKERGAVPRRLRKVYTAGSKIAWADTGRYFHSQMREDRFTEEHARVARYTPRTEKYLIRKQKKFGHRRPLEFSGEVRRLVRTAKITSTSKGGRVAYPGARKLNFRPAATPNLNMADEFRRLTAAERKELAKHYDGQLDREMNSDNQTNTEVL